MTLRGAVALTAVAGVLALAGCSSPAAKSAPVFTDLNPHGHLVGDEVSPPFAAPQGTVAATTGGTYDLADHITGH